MTMQMSLSELAVKYFCILIYLRIEKYIRLCKTNAIKEHNCKGMY